MSLSYADTSGGPPGRNRQELRLALSMRGGLSLAVWIGGAAAEIDRLRAECAAGSQHPWRRIARLGGYDSVSVDVLTGASAGGLNGAILAASLVYGFSFSAMRDLWVRLADIESMSRPTSMLAGPRPESVLEGDAYFRAELARVLHDRVKESDGLPGADRVELLLTATLLEAVEVERRDDRLAVLREGRRAAMFRFRHFGDPGDPLSDFDDRAAAVESGHTTEALALAGRATSSFPFAFEPAMVTSQKEPPADNAPNLFGRFSETAEAGQDPFLVIDGGVLDNIPVAAAIRAIAATPANGPTERWLLYLHPSPASSPLPSERAAPRRRPYDAIGTSITALSAQASQESVLGDVDELDAHNREVARLDLRRRALFAPLASLPAEERADALTVLVTDVSAEHARSVGLLRADDVWRRLNDPATATADAVLAEPWVGDPLKRWTADARALLTQRLADVAEATADPARSFGSARSLLAATDICITWARELEGWAPEEDLPAVGAAKAAFYRLRLFAQVVAERADRCWLAQAETNPVERLDDLDGWITSTSAISYRAEHALPDAAAGPLEETLFAAVASDDDARAADLLFHRRLAELARVLAEASGSALGEVDAIAEGWAALGVIAGRLADVAPARAAGGDADPTVHPQLVGHDLLERAGAANAEATVRQLVVLTAPLTASATAGARIRFLRVGGDAPTPLAFPQLRGKDGSLPVENKLCGNVLFDLGVGAVVLNVTATTRTGASDPPSDTTARPGEQVVRAVAIRLASPPSTVR